MLIYTLVSWLAGWFSGCLALRTSRASRTWYAVGCARQSPTHPLTLPVVGHSLPVALTHSGTRSVWMAVWLSAFEYIYTHAHTFSLSHADALVPPDTTPLTTLTTRRPRQSRQRRWGWTGRHGMAAARPCPPRAAGALALTRSEPTAHSGRLRVRQTASCDRVDRVDRSSASRLSLSVGTSDAELNCPPEWAPPGCTRAAPGWARPNRRPGRAPTVGKPVSCTKKDSFELPRRRANNQGGPPKCWLVGQLSVQHT